LVLGQGNEALKDGPASLGHLADEVEHAAAQGAPTPGSELGFRPPQQGFEGGEVMVFAQRRLEVADLLEKPFWKGLEGTFQGLDGVAQLLDPHPGLVEGCWILQNGKAGKAAEGGLGPGLQTGPGRFLKRDRLEGIRQSWNLQQFAKIGQPKPCQFLGHGAPGFGTTPVHLFQEVLKDRGLGRGVGLRKTDLKILGVDIEFPGQAQGVHQSLQGAPLAPVSGVGLGIHQIEHGAQAPGGHANLVEQFYVLPPAILGQQFLEPGQPDLEGPVEQDRQLGWMHPMSLDTIRYGEKLA